MDKPGDPHNTSADAESYILLCLNAYAISKNILSKNIVQLRQLLNTLEDPKDPAKIWVWENKTGRDALLGELMRHFHNFLTSVTTLIDHTRHLMKEDFITEKHRTEHQEKIEHTFARNPLTIFIRELRHYITHRTIPMIQMSHEESGENKRLEMDLEKIASWNNWSQLARDFIEASKPAIRILDLVDQYEQTALEFHEYFVQRFYFHYYSQIRDHMVARG
jgi:hypothetical protein